MNRRAFLTGVAGSIATTATLGQSAIPTQAQEDDGQATATPTPVPTDVVEDAKESIAQDRSLPKIEWQIATSWPRLLDTLFGGVEQLANRITQMTQGKFTVTARPAGELAGGLEVFNVVQEGIVPMGHSASYYYMGQSPVTAFGTTVPFGLTASQQNAWLYEDGGLAILQEFYAERFGLIQFPAGNTGAQMAGWFNKEIQTVADLDGLRMRISGFGGQILARLGAEIHALPAADIFVPLYEGSLDAAEFVGPYDDEKLGLHKAAPFYYYPGWWEPGATVELEINLDAWNELPEEYQVIVEVAAYETNMTMLARYNALNPPALQRLFDEVDLTLLPFPREVMRACEEEAFLLYEEIAASDSDFKSILQEWVRFRDAIQAWHGLAETAYMNYTAWSLETLDG